MVLYEMCFWYWRGNFNYGKTLALGLFVCMVYYIYRVFIYFRGGNQYLYLVNNNTFSVIFKKYNLLK